MFHRFAAQRFLAEAPLLRGVPPEALSNALDAARLVETYRSPVMGTDGTPELMLTVGAPGRLSYRADLPLASGAGEVLANPPARVASLAFDRASYATRPGPGALRRLEEELPAALQAAGLRPGDLVMGYPVGANHGDFRRAMTFMNAGMGPLDQLQQQRALVGQDYRLQPTMLFPVNQKFGDRMKWIWPLV